MNNYGIRGLVNDWFKNYLSGRQQYVDIDGVTSNKGQIQIGVPQGMILSFADDTTLITSSSNLNELFTNANLYINNLYEWFCSNRLSLNASKTKYIVLRPTHMRYDLSRYNIHIGNTQLLTVSKHLLNFLECILMKI